MNAPATQRTLVRRDPTSGALLTEANPAYQAPDPKFGSHGDPIADFNASLVQARGIAAQKIAELQKAIDTDPTKAPQLTAELQSWWQQNVQPALAGKRTAAEQANAALQAQNDAAQRTENQRAETINRSRETMGLQAGTQMREQAAALTPNVRSNAFLGNVAQMANAWASGKPAQGVNFTPESFRPDPGQIPNMDAIAEIEAAKVLAHISPSAAARLGRPMPQFPALPDMEQFIPPYGAGATGAVA